MPPSEIIESVAAALLWAAIFALGTGEYRVLARFLDRRSVISFSAGMSAAYVFMHMMPELHEVRRTFAAAVSMHLEYEGVATYFLALIGFLTFYGLDHLSTQLHESKTAGRSDAAFWLHLGGFAAYVWLMGYLLVNGLEETRTSIALYAAAVAFHFLAVGNAFRNEHGSVYERVGRFVLAGMSVMGWAAGMLFALPQHVLALAVAFLSGAIIMNSTILELRSQKEGRFWSMMAGGVVYGLILAPFG